MPGIVEVIQVNPEKASRKMQIMEKLHGHHELLISFSMSFLKCCCEHFGNELTDG